MPAVVDLSAEEALKLSSLKEAFDAIGFEIDPVGERAVAVSAYPSVIDCEDPSDAVKEILEQPPEVGDRSSGSKRFFGSLCGWPAGRRSAATSGFVRRRWRPSSPGSRRSTTGPPVPTAGRSTTGSPSTTCGSSSNGPGSLLPRPFPPRRPIPILPNLNTPADGSGGMEGGRHASRLFKKNAPLRCFFISSSRHRSKDISRFTLSKALHTSIVDRPSAIGCSDTLTDCRPKRKWSLGLSG